MHEIAIDRRASAGSPAASRSRRMATISAVAPGARLSRRKNSWRGLSTACCSCGDGGRVGACQIGFGGARDRVGVRLHAVGQEAPGIGGARAARARGSWRGWRWRWQRPDASPRPDSERRCQLVDVVLAVRRRRSERGSERGGPARQCCPAAPGGRKRSRDGLPNLVQARPSQPAKLTLNYNNLATDAFPVAEGAQHVCRGSDDLLSTARGLRSRILRPSAKGRRP